MAKPKKQEPTEIQRLLGDYRKNLETIAEEIDEEKHQATIGARLANKKQAEERNKSISFYLQQELLSKSIFIGVDGDESDKFIDIASKEYGCFNFSDSEFFEELTSTVNSVYFKNAHASSALYDIINNRLDDICQDIGVAQFPLFDMREKDRVLLNSKEDLIKAVSKVFYEQLGGEIVGAFFLYKTSRKLLDLEDFAGKSVPLVFTSENTIALNKGLKNISRNAFLVRASSKAEKFEGSEFYIANLKEVSQDKVEETLLNIKKQLS